MQIRHNDPRATLCRAHPSALNQISLFLAGRDPHTGFFGKHFSMTLSLRTFPPLPSILATAILVALAGTASGAPHPKRHPAIHKPKPAASAEPATTTDAN